MSRLIAPLVLCLAVLAPRADAQSLDGQWFKITVAAKGLGISPGGETGKAAGKFTVYMFVSSVTMDAAVGVPGFDYEFSLFSEVAQDEWQEVVSNGTFSTSADEKAMLGDPTLGIELLVTIPPGAALGGGDELTVRFVAGLKVKLDKQGELKQASFKSLGAIIPEGTSEGLPVIGGAKVKGVTIAPEKLPFTVEA